MIEQFAILVVVIAIIVYKACVARPTNSKWLDSYKAGTSPVWARHIEHDGAFVSWEGINDSDWEWIGARIEITLSALRIKLSLERLFPSMRPPISNLTQATLAVYYSHLMAGKQMAPKDAVAHACSVFFVPDFRKAPQQFCENMAKEMGEQFNDPLPALIDDMLQPIRSEFNVDITPKKVLPQP